MRQTLIPGNEELHNRNCITWALDPGDYRSWIGNIRRLLIETREAIKVAALGERNPVLSIDGKLAKLLT